MRERERERERERKEERTKEEDEKRCVSEKYERSCPKRGFLLSLSLSLFFLLLSKVVNMKNIKKKNSHNHNKNLLLRW